VSVIQVPMNLKHLCPTSPCRQTICTTPQKIEHGKEGFS
jgi:hypothetical protein